MITTSHLTPEQLATIELAAKLHGIITAQELLDRHLTHMFSQLDAENQVAEGQVISTALSRATKEELDQVKEILKISTKAATR